MVFPVLAFIGGAAVGAVAALVLKDRLDRRHSGDHLDRGADVEGPLSDEATFRPPKTVAPVAEAAEVKPAPRRSRAPRRAKPRDAGPPAP